jgi:predicted RNA-binding protein YlxR (DUF448 family)
MTRTCVGCRSAADASELVRLVLGPDGSVVADPRGGALGRGGWVHPTAECVRGAVPRGLSHTLRATVTTTADELLAQLQAAGKRRALSLIGAAFRAHKAAAGSSAAADALTRGQARLVVLAEDAKAAAELGPVVAAIARGESLVVGTKAAVGAALGRPETAVVAILDDGIAASLRRAVALSTLTLPRAARGPKKTEFVTEIG